MWVAPHPALMLRPSGWSWIDDDVGAGRAQQRRGERAGRAVGGVDDDAQPVQAATFEGGEDVVDVGRAGLGVEQRGRIARRCAGGRRRSPRSRASTASLSFSPPGANSLMPLSWYGLCDAEMTAPRHPRRADSNATTGDGTTPRRWTTTPSLASPATNAASSMAVDTRVSPPTTASAPPSTRAAARPRSRAKEAVRSLLATPRTPSVPNFMSGAGPRPLQRVSAW